MGVAGAGAGLSEDGSRGTMTGSRGGIGREKSSKYGGPEEETGFGSNPAGKRGVRGGGIGGGMVDAFGDNVGIWGQGEFGGERGNKGKVGGMSC